MGAFHLQEPSFIPKNVPIIHGFFGCRDGVSTQKWAGLNCSLASGDSDVCVEKNKDLVLQTLREHATGLHRLIVPVQSHSTICQIIDQSLLSSEKEFACDAFITSLSGIVLGVLTADCAPVLFYAKQEKDQIYVVGAAHAGWQGALAGILESTVAGFDSLGIRAQGIHACIGPCIGRVSYEVGAEFPMPFLEQDPYNERFFMAATRTGHFMFDLAGYCAHRLALCGLSQIKIMGVDTVGGVDDFFSFRRGDAGRQVSAIGLIP